jgi:hypothetical protein
VPFPAGKLKLTVPPTGIVTLLSAGSLLAVSCHQFFSGDAVSCAWIAAPDGGVADGDGEGDGDGDGDGEGEGEGEGEAEGDGDGDGVGEGATTVTEPRMFQSSPEWYSYTPGTSNRHDPAQPGPCWYQGNGGDGCQIAPAVCVQEVGWIEKNATLWRRVPSGYEKLTVPPAVIVTAASWNA